MSLKSVDRVLTLPVDHLPLLEQSTLVFVNSSGLRQPLLLKFLTPPVSQEFTLQITTLRDTCLNGLSSLLQSMFSLLNKTTIEQSKPIVLHCSILLSILHSSLTLSQMKMMNVNIVLDTTSLMISTLLLFC